MCVNIHDNNYTYPFFLCERYDMLLYDCWMYRINQVPRKSHCFLALRKSFHLVCLILIYQFWTSLTVIKCKRSAGKKQFVSQSDKSINIHLTSSGLHSNLKFCLIFFVLEWTIYASAPECFPAIRIALLDLFSHRLIL